VGNSVVQNRMPVSLQPVSHARINF
jgi:hypothetical protein